MIVHENRLLADLAREISYPIFFRKSGKMMKKLSSAAVTIGAFRVNPSPANIFCLENVVHQIFLKALQNTFIMEANTVDPFHIVCN